MEILEALERRCEAGDSVVRQVLFAPESGAHYVSAVLLRIPPGHEFALHTHPVSEDCFFVLDGDGEAFEPGRALPLAQPCGVWIPAGQPHGVRAGAEGMLEIGFQAPPDPRAFPFERTDAAPCAALLAAPLPGAAAGAPRWTPVFGAELRPRHLDARQTWLRAGERIVAETADDELVVVVARGALAHPETQHPLPAFAALRLAPHARQELRAVADSLLLAVRARASA